MTFSNASNTKNNAQDFNDFETGGEVEVVANNVHVATNASYDEGLESVAELSCGNNSSITGSFFNNKRIIALAGFAALLVVCVTGFSAAVVSKNTIARNFANAPKSNKGPKSGKASKAPKATGSPSPKSAKGQTSAPTPIPTSAPTPIPTVAPVSASQMLKFESMTVFVCIIVGSSVLLW